MKATIAKLLPVLLLASSCSTGMFLTSGNADDVYYNPADRQVVISKRVDVAREPRIQEQQELAAIAQDTIRVAQGNYSLVDSTNQEFVDENGYPVGDEEYYYGDSGDDFYFSNRINRFYRPSMGFGFYDPWYSGMGFGYGGYNYYDPFYYDFYSPFGMYGSSWYNPWYSPWYNSYYGFGYGYGFGYNPWFWGYDYWDGNWGHNNHGNNDNYHYGPRRSMRTDGVSGSRSGDALKSDAVYARRGASDTGTGSSSLGTKSTTGSQVNPVRSASDPKSASRPSGYRSSISGGQDPQSRSSLSQPDRTNSSSYIRSRTGNSYVQPQSQGSSGLRSSDAGSANRSSSYVRPKTSGSNGSTSSYTQPGSYRSSSQSGTYRGSSGSGRSSGSTSGYSGSSNQRSSGSSYNSGSSSSGRSSGSSSSYSSGSSSGRSSGSSMSSGSSSGSSSSRSGGGSSSGRR